MLLEGWQTAELPALFSTQSFECYGLSYFDNKNAQKCEKLQNSARKCKKGRKRAEDRTQNTGDRTQKGEELTILTR